MLLNRKINCDRVWIELDGLNYVVQSRVIPDERRASGPRVGWRRESVEGEKPLGGSRLTLRVGN